MVVNPYEPPSSCFTKTPRRLVRSIFLFSCIAIVVLGIVMVQRYFMHRYDEMQIELPFATKACLNPISPALVTVGLSGLAMTTLLARRKRTRELCEVIFVVACGSVVGYYCIALYLPWVSITPDLM